MKMTNLLLKIDKEREKRKKAVKDILDFVIYTYDDFEVTNFHKKYYELLQKFAEGKIKRLIISMPPQHGKSEASSRRLPAYLLGIKPDLRIALVSYNITFARKFNRTVQRIIDTIKYSNIFPSTRLNRSTFKKTIGNYIRTADEFEVVEKKGAFKVTGTGGPLTGEKVDVLILDDLYKDYAEANSPLYRQKVIDWYTSVATTRLHNDSQELIVFTRWHEDDLVGFLERKGKVIDYTKDTVLEEIPDDMFLKLNFPALKEGDPTELDPREKGEALWEDRHSRKKLEAQRSLDESKFQALYQGNPKFIDGLLYRAFSVYIPDSLPYFTEIKAYTDTADMGKDYLCSIVYGVTEDKYYYILDIIYTQKSQEITEPLVTKQLNELNVSSADIESNNGGRSFARNVEKGVRTSIHAFFQSKNKESRIITNSATVNKKIIFPNDWGTKYPVFYEHVLKFQKDFKANAFDDAPDVLTGIIEMNEDNENISIRASLEDYY